MDISVDMLLFIAVIGLLQAFLLASIIYFHPRSDHSVSKYLALYIFFLCFPMFTPVVNRLVTWQYLLLMDPFPLLVGPCLLLYVKSHKETITFRKAFPHFILFILYVIFDIGLFIYFKQNYPEGPDVPVEAIRHPSAIVRIPGRFIQMIAYFFIAGRALTSYQRSINNIFSETSEINLGWVRWLINGFLCLTLIMLTMYFFIVTYPQNFRVFILINTAIVTPYIYLVTFKGITQLTLWQKSGQNKEKVQAAIHDVEEVTEVVEGPNERDQKNALSRERREVIVSRTLELMEGEKLYLEAELTLQHLADRMKVPSYQVSLAINEGMNKNFYDLVNGYRVEEAKRKLLDPRNSNIKVLAVGMEAGFNSKTTFNTVFKKFTGLTPTDFRSARPENA